jgi:hypothetical protein
MDRAQQENFFSFGSQQFSNFNLEAWREYASLPKKQLVMAMLFLSRVDWYVHQKELADLAEEMLPGSNENALGLAKETEFNFTRFSNMFREKLTHEKCLS